MLGSMPVWPMSRQPSSGGESLMDSKTFLIALLFGAFAAGLAVIGFSAQEKYLAYRAEHAEVRSVDPEPAASTASRLLAGEASRILWRIPSRRS